MCGRYHFPNGDLFEGPFVAGKMHGKGPLTAAGGALVVLAEFCEGRLVATQPLPQSQSQGSERGRGYEGPLDAAGLKHGLGRFFYPNGDRYEGQWVRNEKQGRGTYFFANGDRYDGEFQAGVKEGTGQYFFANGDVCEGEWRGGTFCGEGSMRTKADGRLFKGSFQKGLPHGACELWGPQGLIYRGTWRTGVPHGEDALFHPPRGSGDEYRGPFEDGLMHGRGEYLFASNPTSALLLYRGSFQAGLFHGQGEQVYRGGEGEEKEKAGEAMKEASRPVDDTDRVDGSIQMARASPASSRMDDW